MLRSTLLSRQLAQICLVRSYTPATTCVFNHPRPSRSTLSLHQRAHLHVSHATCKQKRKRAFEKLAIESSRKDEEEEEEDDDDDDIAAPSGAKKIIVNPMSSRVDSIVKEVEQKSKGTVDEMLVDGKIRVNGQIPRKKSADILSGDLIDVLIGPSPDNPSLTLVNRYDVVDVDFTETQKGRITLVLHKFQALPVSEY